jgi:hypothetical protein
MIFPRALCLSTNLLRMPADAIIQAIRSGPTPRLFSLYQAGSVIATTVTNGITLVRYANKTRRGGTHGIRENVSASRLRNSATFDNIIGANL